MIVEKKRKTRGPSPRGEFETAKVFATTSEDARIAADKRKTQLLREARLQARHAADAGEASK